MAKERPPLEEMTLRQLRKVASDYNIYRYSRKRKQELLVEIQKVMRISWSQVTAAEELLTTPEGQKVEQSKFELNQEEQKVEQSKFELNQEEPIGGNFLSVAQEGELPEGYGESRIVLMPRDPQWTYAYWDIPSEHKQELRRQGGQQLILRLYDVTEININSQVPHSVQEYPCDELAREWYLPVPVSDRDYIVDIGYRTFDGRWLVLARSASVRVPPVYPSDWVEDIFVTVNWEEDLRGKTVYQLVSPSSQKGQSISPANNPMQQAIYQAAQAAEAGRVSGSIFGSMQHLPSSFGPESAVSSYVFPSGVGMWAIPTASGVSSVSSYSSYSGYAQTSLSGVGMLPFETISSGSGVGMLGFSASAAPERSRKFWLVADAELIVYGATEPDATVTIGGRPIKLNPDGTFRFQMSFQDGLIDYPIMAVAVDGEQTRSIHMKFNRETPSRHTNTKEEAILERY